MLLRFTNAGKALFEINPTALSITRVVLTDAFNYVLPNPPVSLQGTPVYDLTQTLLSYVENPNTLKFTVLLDNSIGDFNYGEVGLYSGATLVAIGVSSTLISKVKAAGSENGNYQRFEAFLSYANADSYGFLKLSDSDSRMQLGQVQHVDYLEPPFEGDPNVFVVNGLTPTDMPQMAFSDYFGRWNFTGRPQSYYTGVVSNASNIAVDIAADHGVTFATPNDYVLQFLDGKLRGYCRELISIGSTFFQWNRPTLDIPEVGTRFIICGPQVTNVTVSGQSSISFQDDGNALGLPGANVINFTGSAVTASRSGNIVTVNIAGGSSVANLVDLTDVSDTEAVTGQTLVYSGGWIPEFIRPKPKPMTITTISGNAPLSLGSSAHHNTIFRLSGTIDVVVNIPAESAWTGTQQWFDNNYSPVTPGPMGVGESFILSKHGAGNIVINPSPGVVINTPDSLILSKMNGKVVLVKVGVNQFDLEGNLSP